MKFHNLEQGSREWHEFRRIHIGASESPAIVGKSSWASASDILAQKVSGKIEPPSFVMKRGTNLEPKVRAMAEAQLNMAYTPYVVTSDKLSWMSASLDGLSEDGKSIIEIKCGSVQQYEEALRGKVPEGYMIQMQHQLFVTELNTAYFVTFWNEEIAIVKVDRWEAEKMNELIEILKEFYKKLSARFKNFKEISIAEEKPREDDIPLVKFEHARASRILAEILEICQRQKEDDARKEILKRDLYDLSPDQNFILDGVKFIRSQRSSYDYKLMEADGMNLDKYKKAGEPFWTIKQR